MTTTLAPASAVAAAGLAGLALGRRLPAAVRAVAVLAVAGSFGLTGHAATAPPRWLTAPTLTLHALCGALWLGSLVPLVWSLGLERRQALAVLRRFSSVALAAVALLVAAGCVLAWIQLDRDLAALTATAYGWRLLGKLALVAALLALAAVNRLVLTPALGRARPGTERCLRLSLGADLALGLAVLAVTATFPLSPPPRALAAPPDEIAGEGITVVVSGNAGQAALTLLPGRAGTNRLEAWVTDRDGLPLAGKEATLAWTLPAGGAGPGRASTAFAAPGALAVPELVLERPGRWRLRLEVSVDESTRLTFEGEVDLP